MALKYDNGDIDPRPCIGTRGTYSRAYALMVNDDGTIDEILYDDTDRGNHAWATPVKDATPEILTKVASKARVGNRAIVTPHYDNYKTVQKGDIVEVVKGRKYPKGTKIEVEKTSIYTVPNTYGKKWIGYILGTNGEKVNADNCVVVSVL